MKTKLTFKSTLHACYLGYITQAIVVNLTPLFFVLFKDNYGLTNGQIGTIVFVLFVTQFLIDAASARFLDRIGFRRAAILAHVSATVGLLLLGILPRVMPSYGGIMIAVIISAIGAGIIEVLISPIVDLLPAESKSSAMSLLHAFYCWGQVVVVALSTLLLAVLGDGFWYIIPMMWAVIPAIDAVFFAIVPMPEPAESDETSAPWSFVRTKLFVMAAFVMTAGAMAELSMSQWASYFAERGLGINKVAGDLLGPCMFGICMAIGRTLYGIHGAKLKLSRVLILCSVICSAGYLLTVFSPYPALALAGCGISGLGVSLLWPGTLSLTSGRIPGGGTRLFALLALFGDLGCSVGPWLTGIVSDGVAGIPAFVDLASSWGMPIDQLALKIGLLLITVFPIVSTFVIRAIDKDTSPKKS